MVRSKIGSGYNFCPHFDVQAGSALLHWLVRVGDYLPGFSDGKILKSKTHSIIISGPAFKILVKYISNIIETEQNVRNAKTLIMQSKSSHCYTATEGSNINFAAHLLRVNWD